MLEVESDFFEPKLAFLAAGGSKLAGAPAMVAMFAKIGFGQWFRILTGLLEVAGAIGLFVPRGAVYAASMLAVVWALLDSTSQDWVETIQTQLPR